MAGSTTLSDSSSSSSRSRTLAIIKAHAIKDRFEIESRISSSGFEIIKERQMGFHDEDAGVRELFGEAALSLSGEPVWIYVLERRRAVEVWKTVMGPEDPEVARVDAPDSLRALFGHSVMDNAVYGSPDASMAELQINSIFVSSPVFPPAETHYDDADIPQESLDQGFSGEEDVRVDVKSKTQGFKARPVPPTIAVPSIQPRTTRAAALRAGVDVPAQKRAVASRESIAKTFENVPGHKRAIAVNVASVAPPSIAPRPTRASALRTGQIEVSPKRGGPPVATTARKPNSPERIKEIFADVPGHKRRQTIAVASTAPPSVAPRPTRASVLRLSQGGVPAPTRPRASTTPQGQGPSSPERPAIRSQVSFEGVPGHKRSTTIEVPSTRPPSATPRINRSAALRLAHKEGGGPKAPPSSFFMKPEPPRSSSSASYLPPSTSSAASTSNARSASVEPGRRAESRNSIAATPRPPSIVPRSNKSALLRSNPPPARKVFAF